MTAIIIEDDIAWRSKLQIMLDELGVLVMGIASNNNEAAALLKKHVPNFILSDILLGDTYVFDLFKNNPRLCKIPTILLTTSEKNIHYKQANTLLNKCLYIVKPIHELTLKSTIECLVGSILPNELKKINSLKIKGTHNETIDIPFDKIVYLSQKLKYCTIYTSKNQFTIKKSMNEVANMLDDGFLRVHTSFIINTHCIKSIGVGLKSIKLNLNDVAIPVGFTYIDALKKHLAKKIIE